MNHFITAATFNFQHEIFSLKNILEQEEIACFFENETIVGINPFGSIAYGGIKLKVHPNDLEVVQSILKDLNENNSLKIV